MKTFIANMFQKKKKSFLYAVTGGLVLIVILLGFILYQTWKPEKKKPEPDIKASLEKVIERNDLNTLEYPVIRAISVYDEKGEKIKYHVSYEGKVIAGIDMSKVTVQVEKAASEEEKSKIIITLPQAEHQGFVVDEKSLDYIFLKKKYETETIYAEAYKECKEDLKTYAKQNKSQLELARTHAISEMKAFLLPFEEALKEKYTLEIK